MTRAVLLGGRDYRHGFRGGLASCDENKTTRPVRGWTGPRRVFRAGQLNT